MFVLSKTYSSVKNKNDELQKEIVYLRAKNTSLSNENDSLKTSFSSPISNSEEQFTNALLSSSIECINQIEGIRQTVLESYSNDLHPCKNK
ncbi:hypothetical protein [Pseudoalteromonas sp. TB64]|uniref:hypothetical protein n=1 Tax=Pseudoalteromonas sp. TB64 TaxID=1938600 RepID=UPI00046523F9|nr:hypothetical protein [Pseudoalteromonas sp. TB64]